MIGSVEGNGCLASRGTLALRAPATVGLRVWVAAALVTIGLGAALHESAGGAARVPSAAGAVKTTGLALLPAGLQGPASSALGESSAAYRIAAGRGTLSAVNPAQGLHASFSRAGVLIAAGDSRIALGLVGLAFGPSRVAVAAAAPASHANRVSYDHGNVKEWYANGPLGIEQGFTIAGSARAASPSMTLSLALSANAAARLADSGHSVLFTRHGRSAIRYDGLQVTDAAGRRLPAGFELRRGQILIRMDVRNARFPVRVDPFVQQGGKLSPGGGETGRGVAVSADGSTAIVGAPLLNKALVFTRSGSTWSLQATLKTTEQRGRFGDSSFGAAVALSADGEVALVGAPGDLEEEGAAWIYTRSGGTWHQAGTRFQDSECVWCRGGVEGNEPESGDIRFGISVALSASGETAIIGAPGQEETEGAAIILTRSGSVWHQTGEFVGAGEAGSRTSEFGRSVALSGNGATALIGGPGDAPTYPEAEGAAWVFTSSGGKWTQQGPKLTGGEEIGSEAYFGQAVSLSADGNTALIGGSGDDGNEGAAWVFTRSGETWSQQGPKLTASGETEGWFGEAVTLSPDGNTALIGAPRQDAFAGAAWEFTRAEETWTQRQEITADGESGAGKFGASLSLSETGELALIGAPAETGGGSARSFVQSDIPVVSTGAATELTSSSATFHATVNPNGEEVTSCVFEYGTGSAYGSSVPCSTAPGAGEEAVAVSAPVAELTDGTTYHFRIAATNSSGTNTGEDATLFTMPDAPTVVTEAATSVGDNAAQLNATVNPNGGTVTECQFEYGTTPSLGSSAACVALPGSGHSPVAVSAFLSGLAEHASYYYRIAARNVGGTGTGAQQSFTTFSGPPEFGRCVAVTAGTGRFSSSKCTTLGGKQGYEWNPGVAGTKFTLADYTTKGEKSIELVTASKADTVYCRYLSARGEYTSSQSLGAMTLKLTSCLQGPRACTSPGAASGEIDTSAMVGSLGIETLGATSAKDRVGIALYPEVGPQIAEFTCFAGSYVLRGSIIGEIKADKAAAEPELKFKAAGIKQEPESFAGGSRDVLEESIAGGAYEQVGMDVTMFQTNPEPIEVNTVQ